MKKLKTIILATICSFVCTSAIAGDYEVQLDEPSIQGLVTMWIEKESKIAIWEAPQNALLKDVNLINKELRKADNFQEAIERLNYIITEYTNSTSFTLVACIYDNAVVIRTINQPNCSIKI